MPGARQRSLADIAQTDSVDPQDADATDQLDHAILKLNLKGLKVGPIYQDVHPADSRFLYSLEDDIVLRNSTRS